MEFQFKREVLAQLGLDMLPKVLEHLSGLWSYATTEWLKLCVPSEADKTRSRWPVHPLWMALASVDWETPGGPLSREFTARRAPSRQWIGAKALSLIASLAAIFGEKTFAVAREELLEEASLALGELQRRTFRSEDAIFCEMRTRYTRLYNLRLNSAADPDDDESNPYYRAKQGL